jgi:hypothetical protein
MTQTADPSPIFSLSQASELLPQVKHLTADAVRRSEALASQLRGLAEDNPEHSTLSAALRDVVSGWAAEVQALGLQAKDFGLSTPTMGKNSLELSRACHHPLPRLRRGLCRPDQHSVAKADHARP